MSKCEVEGDMLSNGWMGRREDSYPQGTKCFLCPLPHVHHQLHNLYLYTSPLESVSTGVIYWYQQVIFYVCLQLLGHKQQLRKQHVLLETRGSLTSCWGDLHIQSMSLRMKVQNLGTCVKEKKRESRERGGEINKGMEHIKSQCWVVRQTHWFPAIAYSIGHWMVDKSKPQFSCLMRQTSLNLRGHRTGRQGRLRGWENHVGVHKTRPGRKT